MAETRLHGGKPKKWSLFLLALTFVACGGSGSSPRLSSGENVIELGGRLSPLHKTLWGIVGIVLIALALHRSKSALGKMLRR